MKKFLPVLFVILVVVAFSLWWFSPAQVIQRRTHNLLRTMTLEAGSGKAARQMGGHTLNALLAAEVELRSEALPQANGVFDRSELQSAYSWLCEQAEESRFEVRRIDSVSIDGDHGTVRCMLNALVVLPNSRPVDGNYEVILHWTLEDDSWRLARATWGEP